MEQPDFSPVESMDLTAGALCLDFVNTGSRLPERQGVAAAGEASGDGRFGDRLKSYADLVTFGERTGVVDLRLGGELRSRGVADPEAAAAVLAQARLLREALYRVFVATEAGDPPAELDLRRVQRAGAASAARQELVSTAGGLELAWPDEVALERVLWPLATSALSLLTAGNRDRVKECAAHDCHWLFLDASRNRSRRWCDMKACGNRAKARQYYHRHQVG